MSADYTLPPVPDHPEPRHMRWSSLERKEIADYGHACAEAARAPLLARIAELEQSVETFRAARDGYRDDAFRLSADKRALLQGHEEQASEISRLRAEVEALRACLSEHLRAAVACQNSVIETRGTDGMDRLSFANDKARALLAQPAGSWVNPLAVEVEALRAALSQCATAVGASAAPDCSVQFLACVPREVELVVEKLRAASVIEWEEGRSYTAVELLRRAIRGLRVRKDHDLWPAVRNMCGVGSGVAHYLCRWAGRDPDTGREIAARKGEGSEG